MPDATTRGPWDDAPPKATEVLDPALEKIKWGLEETMRARDAEIRELKAAMSQMLNQFEQVFIQEPAANYHYPPYLVLIKGEQEILGDDCEKIPELTRYLCERNGWPNPLEGGEK